MYVYVLHSCFLAIVGVYNSLNTHLHLANCLPSYVSCHRDKKFTEMNDKYFYYWLKFDI